MKISVCTGPLTQADAEILSAIHRAAFQPSGARGWSADEISDLLDKPTALLVTTDSAFILAEIVCGEAEVTTIAVDPSRQNEGLGQKLLEAFFVECRCRYVTRCVLEVAINNINAIRLYNSFNFTRIAIRERYFRINTSFVSAIVMEKLFENN